MIWYIPCPDMLYLYVNTTISMKQPKVIPEITKGGKYHCTIDLLFDWFVISCMTTDNFCFNFQNGLIQTSHTGGQQYSDNSPLVFPGHTQNID